MAESTVPRLDGFHCPHRCFLEPSNEIAGNWQGNLWSTALLLPGTTTAAMAARCYNRKFSGQAHKEPCWPVHPRYYTGDKTRATLAQLCQLPPLPGCHASRKQPAAPRHGTAVAAARFDSVDRCCTGSRHELGSTSDDGRSAEPSNYCPAGRTGHAACCWRAKKYANSNARRGPTPTPARSLPGQTLPLAAVPVLCFPSRKRYAPHRRASPIHPHQFTCGCADERCSASGIVMD
nr:unnamed protein product [Digitaria exilis]